MKEERKEPCFPCLLRANYPYAKYSDPKFFYERKEEFYPEEDYGDFVPVCESCRQELVKYYFCK